MLAKISNRLYYRSTGPVAATALALFLLFMGFVLPAQAEQAAAVSGEAGSPDSSFFYTADDLYRMAAAYGEDGRRAYIQARFTFDIVWPLVYMLFLATGISWLFGRVFPPGSTWRWANLVPLAGGLFDFLENLGAALVMARFPQSTPVVAELTPLFTMVKWILVNGSFLLLLAGLLVGVWGWLRRRGSG